MKRDQKHDINGRLFQAKMWREYATALGKPNTYAAYLRQTQGLTRELCIRRARVNLYLARRLNRS